MKSLYEYSDGEIGLILIGGSAAVALVVCLGLCGILHRSREPPVRRPQSPSCNCAPLVCTVHSLNSHRQRRRGRGQSSSSEGDVGGEGGHGHHGESGGGGVGVGRGIIRQQSQSVVRGEHPIAFMLPTVKGETVEGWGDDRVPVFQVWSSVRAGPALGALQRVLRPGEHDHHLLRQPLHFGHPRGSKVGYSKTRMLLVLSVSLYFLLRPKVDIHLGDDFATSILIRLYTTQGERTAFITVVTVR